MPREVQLTRGNWGRILTNANVWSPDGEWIVYDTRSDPAGENFDGNRIEALSTKTGEVRVLYQTKNGVHCGVATWHPKEFNVAFILGPENPTAEWNYGPSRRRGVIVDFANPGVALNLDARNLVAPFTPGALRGGSHVHVWHPQGELLSFTYDDQLVGGVPQRNIGVSTFAKSVTVPKTHPRNHDGSAFSVLATRTVAEPKPGSDHISRAFEEAWIGSTRSLAFQGHVRTLTGETISEVFGVDLPNDLTSVGLGPLEGTADQRPFPPRGTVQRRLTNTTDHKFPGIQGPRHWLRSSPDGSQIGFLKKDDAGVVQFWTVDPRDGPPQQITHNPHPVSSCFTWHPDGRRVAFAMDSSICVTDVTTGTTTRLTPRSDDSTAPRPGACDFSPLGDRIAFVRRLPDGAGVSNQICTVTADP